MSTKTLASTRMKLRKFFSLQLAWAAIIPALAFAQIDTLRIATYNLLKFPSSMGTSRVPYFRTVIEALRPDILIVQELESQAGQLTFLNQVLNASTPNLYQAAPFVNGFDTDNALFYRNGKVTLYGANQIHTDLRDISEYALSANGVEFNLYSLHLKASSGTSNENQRLAEATVLRNYLNALPANTNFIIGGDFNLYRSSEPALMRLLGSQSDNDGRAFDPLNAVGTWNNNSAFAGIHTQATRTTALSDSGATGGLDDRFDLLLVSAAVLAPGGIDLSPANYHPFGNDGRHFNQAINAGTNTVVSATVANALYYASDHLPLYADFVVGTTTAVTETDAPPPANFAFRQNYPNPFTAGTGISFTVFQPQADLSVRIYDITGSLIRTLWEGPAAAGEFHLSWDSRDATGARVAAGVYFCRLATMNLTAVRKMMLLE